MENENEMTDKEIAERLENWGVTATRDENGRKIVVFEEETFQSADALDEWIQGGGKWDCYAIIYDVYDELYYGGRDYILLTEDEFDEIIVLTETYLDR